MSKNPIAHPTPDTAQTRIAWALWHSTGLPLEALRQRWPHLPWDTCAACPYCGRPGNGEPCAPHCPPREEAP